MAVGALYEIGRLSVSNHDHNSLNNNGHCIFASSIKSLLALYDESFVYACYNTLLYRQPTNAEFTYSISHASSNKSRVALVVQLVESEEGRSVDVQLPGLHVVVKRYKRYQIPVAGWFFSLFYLLKSLCCRITPSGEVIRLSPAGCAVLKHLLAEADKSKSLKAKF